MKRKEAIFKGLEFIPIFFEDTSLTSPEYFQITEFPTKLTSGKNLFKLRGHPTNLRPGGVLGIEILDYNGDPIYHEIINFIDDDKSRVIAIYIYSETPPGDCTITLVAEAQIIEGGPAPLQQQGKPNVRWSRSVPVNPETSNISEIIYTAAPIVNITEQIGVQLDRSYPNNEQFPTYNTGNVRYFSQNNKPIIEVIGGEFTPDMKDGTITISTPTNPIPTPAFPADITAYSSTIKKVLNTGSLVLDTEYTVFLSQSLSSHTYNAFDASSYTITYEATPTYTATENSQSFAYIQVSNLSPDTGDVSRLKVFTSNKGTPDTFKLVNDFEIEESEIFIESTSSLFPDETIGLFTSQSLIDFWQAETIINGSVSAPAPTLIFNTSSLSNACIVTSTTDISAENDVHIFRVKDPYAGTFIKDSEYKIRLDAIGTRSTNSGNLNPKLLIYVSGSSFNFNSTDTLNQSLPINIGKKIGEIEVLSNSRRYDDEVFSFESNETGKGVLFFIIEAGDWQIADVHVTTDNDSGYTPNFFRIKTPIETTHKINNQITFKLEYYNVQGVRSNEISLVNNLDWEGGNRYIDGDYSLMTGSLYVADSLNSGVAISGFPNAGFIRSLGYQGFDSGFGGWMIWSGSALPGQTSKGNAYSGVGLELFNDSENFFRYSTSDNELDIRTKKFFLGDVASTFVSGSNGLLEISSSNFHLTPEGNITASSAVFKDEAGNIMFDTKARFVDALNVGRVVFYDKTETSLDLANINGVALEETGSVFQTFLLPGETNVLMSCTYEVDNTAASGNEVTSVRSRAFIQSASLGPSTSTNIYGAFDTTSQLGSTVNITTTDVDGGDTLSGAVNVSYSGNQVAPRGGMYVQIHVAFHVTHTNSPTGTLKLKNFVFRTSRALGSSTDALSATPGPITFP